MNKQMLLGNAEGVMYVTAAVRSKSEQNILWPNQLGLILGTQL